MKYAILVACSAMLACALPQNSNPNDVQSRDPSKKIKSLEDEVDEVGRSKMMRRPKPADEEKKPGGPGLHKTLPEGHVYLNQTVQDWIITNCVTQSQDQAFNETQCQEAYVKCSDEFKGEWVLYDLIPCASKKLSTVKKDEKVDEKPVGQLSTVKEDEKVDEKKPVRKLRGKTIRRPKKMGDGMKKEQSGEPTAGVGGKGEEKAVTGAGDGKPVTEGEKPDTKVEEEPVQKAEGESGKKTAEEPVEKPKPDETPKPEQEMGKPAETTPNVPSQQNNVPTQQSQQTGDQEEDYCPDETSPGAPAQQNQQAGEQDDYCPDETQEPTEQNSKPLDKNHQPTPGKPEPVQKNQQDGQQTGEQEDYCPDETQEATKQDSNPVEKNHQPAPKQPEPVGQSQQSPTTKKDDEQKQPQTGPSSVTLKDMIGAKCLTQRCSLREKHIKECFTSLNLTPETKLDAEQQEKVKSCAAQKGSEFKTKAMDSGVLEASKSPSTEELVEIKISTCREKSKPNGIKLAQCTKAFDECTNGPLRPKSVHLVMSDVYKCLDGKIDDLKKDKDNNVESEVKDDTKDRMTTASPDVEKALPETEKKESTTQSNADEPQKEDAKLPTPPQTEQPAPNPKEQKKDTKPTSNQNQGYDVESARLTRFIRSKCREQNPTACVTKYRQCRKKQKLQNPEPETIDFKGLEKCANEGM